MNSSREIYNLEKKMLSFKEESEISVCAHSMDRVMPAGLVEKSTAPVRKSIGLAKSLKSLLYFFTVLGLTSCAGESKEHLKPARQNASSNWLVSLSCEVEVQPLSLWVRSSLKERIVVCNVGIWRQGISLQNRMFWPLD